MKIFLSYPRKDTDKAKQLKGALFKGGHTVWMDDQLITGQGWRDQLEAQIMIADAIALAITPNWIASPYCNWEFITGIENGKQVIPVLLAQAALPKRMSQYQYADLSGGFEDAKVQKLLNDLVVLTQNVQPSVISDMNKEDYAMTIDQKNEGGGHNINVGGEGNTVAGGDIDQSRQSIRTGGNLSGANINIGGKQTFHGDVNIQYGALASSPTDSSLNELKTLLQELEAALKQQPADKAEDVELAQEYANQIVEEASKDAPRKKKLEITGDSLKKAAENLLGVAPIVAKIVQKLLVIG